LNIDSSKRNETSDPNRVVYELKMSRIRAENIFVSNSSQVSSLTNFLTSRVELR